MDILRARHPVRYDPVGQFVAHGVHVPGLLPPQPARYCPLLHVDESHTWHDVCPLCVWYFPAGHAYMQHTVR